MQQRQQVKQNTAQKYINYRCESHIHFKTFTLLLKAVSLYSRMKTQLQLKCREELLADKSVEITVGTTH